MAIELPYFKFYTNAWNDGDITLEVYELQGIFINICSYYWSKDCDVSESTLSKKFRGLETQIKSLVNSGILKINDGKICIEFLNEQLKSKEVQKITNRKNGLLGGRPIGKKTEKKPNGLNFANRNVTESITETKANDNPNITNIKESKVDKNIYVRGVKTPPVDFDKFISGFNTITSRNFKATDKVKSALKKRLKTNTMQDIFRAIANAYKEKYHIDTSYKYLTPEFILRDDKFERYFNQSIIDKTQGYTPHLTN